MTCGRIAFVHPPQLTDMISLRNLGAGGAAPDGGERQAPRPGSRPPLTGGRSAEGAGASRPADRQYKQAILRGQFASLETALGAAEQRRTALQVELAQLDGHQQPAVVQLMPAALERHLQGPEPMSIITWKHELLVVPFSGEWAA